ncbi:MAG TPA: penicillin-binding protein 2, partial [Vampirovibrionales bacterium]
MGSKEKLSFGSVEGNGFDFRPAITLLVLVFGFGAILIKLFVLQIIEGPSIAEKAQENTTFILHQNAPRGIIYDREKRVIVSNKQSPSVIIIPSVVLGKDVSNIAKSLAIIINKPTSYVLEKLKKLDENDSRPHEAKWLQNLKLEQLAAIYEHQYDLPGVLVQQHSARHYVYGDLLAHVLGYTGKISEEELNSRSHRDLHDIVGKYGIEKVFDSVLRGKSAKKRIRINRFGQPTERVSFYDSAKTQTGTDITLTIDLDMQRAAEKAMDDKGFSGAIVMIKAKTGEVLALVSRPSFSPKTFTGNVDEKEWQRIQSQKVFLNRAISAYPPGSIWKPYVLLAALETNAVKPTEKFKVGPAHYIGRTRFGDWTDKRGIFTLQKSLAWSRDTAFYQMGERMSDSDITKYGMLYGAGKLTGLELQDEQKGIVPNAEWKQKVLNNHWYPGNTLHYSIGQGYLLLTPAQAARMVAGIANKTELPSLNLIRQIGNQLPAEPKNVKLPVSQDKLKIVLEGMEECVDSGTCQIVKMPGIKLAGKTGSAESASYKKTHGWFIAYGPTENPEIAIAAFAEGAGHGGSVAAPMALEVMKAY